MSLLFLVGMPGAGKTWWGRAIAEHYDLLFFDTDDIIEKNSDLTIAGIFKEYGEEHFRRLESEVLQHIIDENTTTAIVACGGGTPVWNDNMNLMKNVGAVVYLKAEISTLLNNIREDAEVRPLLSLQADKTAYLQHLLGERKKVYEQADHILEVENISMINFDKIINSCTDRH